METDYRKKTIPELRLELQRLRLKTTGNKAALVERLRFARKPLELKRSLDKSKKRRNNHQTSEVPNAKKKSIHTEDVSSMEETDTGLSMAQLVEWERSLQERETRVRDQEAQLANFDLNNVPDADPQVQNIPSVLPQVQHEQPELALRTISLRDVIDILPEFNPDDRTTLDAKQFVERVTRLKDAYHWGDSLLILAVQAKLNGNAKVWADAQREIHQRWGDFAADLLQNFPNHRQEADGHIELATTRRNNNESLSSYYHRMCSVARRVGINDASTIKYIRNGLNHNALRHTIAGMQFNTCLELYAFLYRFEENLPTRGDSTRYVSNKTENVPIVCSEFSGYRPQAQGREFRCYNCNEIGHLSVNCPKPQRRIRCAKCNKSGHGTSDCLETKQPRPLNNPFNVTPNATSKLDMLSRSTTSNGNVRRIRAPSSEISECLPRNITKSINMGNHQFITFVDPGSDRSLIRESIAHRTGEVRMCKSFLLKGFGGGTYSVNKCVQDIIKIDKITIKGNLYVVPDELLPEDVLLGKDILCRPGIRLVIESGKCNVEYLPVNINMTDSENEEFQSILYEFSECFSSNLSELGRATTTEMSITLKNDAVVNCRPYRTPFAKRETVNKIVNELLDLNIIRHSTSPYASPIVLVKKQNGEDRLCVDYRQLNAVTVKQPYPMPVVEEQLASLSGNTIFTSLDLVAGYHQIPIVESSKKYTAFVTNDGHFEYNRMPFGLVNAPSVFQTTINNIVQQLCNGEAIAYLDDVIIPSVDIREGLDRLRKFLAVLKTTGLTLRTSKCKFLSNEVKFLGHRISKDGMIPGNEKTEAIRMFPAPINLHELRRFLGLTGFFRKFVANYAEITRPLRPLLKTKNNPSFIWTADHEQAFTTLKHCLIGEPVLVLYDQRKEHEVHTDASATGLAAVLLQNEANTWRPVFYFSRHNNDAERNYHSYELEVLAIVEALERFKVYLLGKRFRVITDCAAITATKLHTPLLPRIARWWLKLQEFDFETIHRPAEQMQHADALSRNPHEIAHEPTTVADRIFRIEINRDDWLATMQHQDPKLEIIFQYFKENSNDPLAKENRKLFKIVNNRLFRIDGDQLKWVVPSAVRWRILKSCHDDRGHFALEKTIQTVQRDFWFRRIRDYAKKYIKACIECCYNKRPGGKTEGRLYVEADQPPIPFRTLHIDHLGPFVKSKRGHSYVVGISDPFTKYVIIRAVRNTKTAPIIEILNLLTSFFGLPQTVITDRGTAFTSSMFENYCSSNNIQHIKNAVRTPRANGQIERVNGSILSFLRTTTTETKSWDINLRTVQWTLNSQRNRTTGFTPNELLFDFNPIDILQNRVVAALHHEMINSNDESTISEKRIIAATRVKAEREKWKLRFDQRHLTPTQFAKDDLVVIENMAPATGESRKLEPVYRGPYIVSKVLGRDRYVVADIPGMPRTQKSFSSIFTSGKMKHWCCANELDGDSDEDNDTCTGTVHGQEGPSVRQTRSTTKSLPSE